jgi:hypothetical protein
MNVARRVRFFPLVCGVIVLLSTVTRVLDAGESLTLKVTPEVSFAPATVRIQVRLEPSPDNRGLEIVANSENYYRSSLVEFGDRAPRIVTVDFRGLPSGKYEISGALKDGGGQERERVRQQAVVIPSGPEH